VVAAFDVTVVPFFTGTHEHCPLLLASARAAGHAATVGSGESQDIRLSQPRGRRKLLRMNDDEPWECSFQVHPCAVDIFGAYGVGATAILRQLARKRSEHTFKTLGACIRLVFQSLSVALQNANARNLRCMKAFVSPPSLLPQLPRSAKK
jgi:hypothetical protein